MKGIRELIGVIDRSRDVVIQSHDFPDHDAVACAFALQHLLKQADIDATACYRGRIQSASLLEAIKWLQIPIRKAVASRIANDAQIIVVDSFYGSRNLSGLPGEVVAMIDHHSALMAPECKYSDVRNQFGACSTILFEYFRTSETDMPREVASALLIGLMMDTAFMTRGVHPADLDAFSTLYHLADWEYSVRLLRNSLSIDDLVMFHKAIQLAKVQRDFCFVPIDLNCRMEVAALIADFFLGLREIHFVVAAVPGEKEWRLSVRSESPDRPADDVIRRALTGIGSGGGHWHMGGGIIPRDSYPGDEALIKRFIAACKRPAGVS